MFKFQFNSVKNSVFCTPVYSIIIFFLNEYRQVSGSNYNMTCNYNIQEAVYLVASFNSEQRPQYLEAFKITKLLPDFFCGYYWPLYSCLCDTNFHSEILFLWKKEKMYICRKGHKTNSPDINKLKKYTISSLEFFSSISTLPSRVLKGEFRCSLCLYGSRTIFPQFFGKPRSILNRS